MLRDVARRCAPGGRIHGNTKAAHDWKRRLCRSRHLRRIRFGSAVVDVRRIWFILNLMSFVFSGCWVATNTCVTWLADCAGPRLVSKSGGAGSPKAQEVAKHGQTAQEVAKRANSAFAVVCCLYVRWMLHKIWIQWRKLRIGLVSMYRNNIFHWLNLEKLTFSDNPRFNGT